MTAANLKARYSAGVSVRSARARSAVVRELQALRRNTGLRTQLRHECRQLGVRQGAVVVDRSYLRAGRQQLVEMPAPPW